MNLVDDEDTLSLFTRRQDKPEAKWCSFFDLKSSMWILLRLRYVKLRPVTGTKSNNARSGALSAQILDFTDKLDPGDLEFLFFFTLDFAL